MLIRFSTENFLSFDKRIEFFMSASKITRLKEHVIQVGDKRVLKGGFIFGANAGGKSNFIKAVSFSKNIVIKGIKNVDINKKHFRIKKENFAKPGVFQFDIMIDSISYSYGFTISYERKEIIDEWLYRTSGTELCIFSKEIKNGKVSVISNLTIVDIDDKNRFAVYRKDIENKSMRQTLLLTDIANRSSDKSKAFKIFKDIYHWFQSIVIIYPDSKYNGLNQIASNEDTRCLFKEMLTYFDTGVEDVLDEVMDFDKALGMLNDEEKEDFKLKISNTIGDKLSTYRIGKTLVSIRKDENNDIFAQKLVLNHGNEIDLFDYIDESDGTQRLLDLIPLFQKSKFNSVIFIDEIDRSLHSKLTAEFIRKFYEISKGSNTQLIATTHDLSLMDLDLIRQDEIWFIERQQDHSTQMYSLNKFKERYDKKVENDYLIGRYGAIPIFNTFLSLDCDKEDVKDE